MQNSVTDQVLHTRGEEWLTQIDKSSNFCSGLEPLCALSEFNPAQTVLRVNESFLYLTRLLAMQLKSC